MTDTSVEYTIHKPGVDHLLVDPAGEYGQWLTRSGNRIVTGAKRRVNVDTGYLRSTIGFRLKSVEGRLDGEVYADANYARYVHDGTRYYAGNPFLLDAIRDELGGL